MKKISSLLLAIVLSVSMLSGCATSESSSVAPSSEAPSSEAPSSEAPSSEAPSSEEPATELAPMKIASLKGPTTMGMVYMMNEAESTESNYEFEMHGTPDAITGPLLAGELDVAAIPANLAATLYNKSNGALTVLGINTLGVLYVVENGESINSIEDLKGKTLYSTGKGTTPEFALNYILTQNGIDPATDLTIEYKSEATEIAALMAQDNTAIAVLPQPYVSVVQSQSETLRVALDLTEEWNNVQPAEGGSSLVTGVTVVRTAYLTENKETVDEFLRQYAESVEYINTDLDGGAALVGKYEIAPEAVAKVAIPYCNIVLTQQDEMKEKLSGYLKVLFDANPESVGGALPDDNFYYMG